MGSKVSVVHGVKSADFYKQGNAINEIWIGDVELVSRLPFGDSDLGQAGWPKGSWPKIPWHQFIIPLKRSIDTGSDTIMATNGTAGACPGTIRDIWPDTGFYSHFQAVPPSVAFVLSAMLLAFGLGLALFPFERRALMSRELSLYQRLRVRVTPPGTMERVIKWEYWFATGFALFCWVSGVILVFLALPLVLWTSQHKSIPALIAMLTVDLLIITGFMTLYQLVRLFIMRRRALAKQRETASMYEKAEEDLPVMTLTFGEHREFLNFIRKCPERDRNCYCKIP